MKLVHASDLIKKLGLAESDARKVLAYLAGEGFLTLVLHVLCPDCRYAIPVGVEGRPVPSTTYCLNCDKFFDFKVKDVYLAFRKAD
jgi:hypothetical protein